MKKITKTIKFPAIFLFIAIFALSNFITLLPQGWQTNKLAQNFKTESVFAATRTYYMYFNTGTGLPQPPITTNTTCPVATDTALTTTSGIALLADADDTTCVPGANRDVTWSSSAPTLSLYYNGSGYASAMNITGTSVGIRAKNQVSTTAVLTAKLFYTKSDNTKVYFSGTPPTTPAMTTTRTEYQINLSGLSATNVPAGSKIGIEFSWNDASGVRLAVNPTVTTEKLIVNEVVATNTTTLGTDSDPVASTVAPGSGAADVDMFTLQTDSGTESITSVTVNLSTANGVDRLSIADNANNELGFTSAPTAGSNVISVSGMSANTSSTIYKVRVTPLSHVAMPAVPGGEYAITAPVTAWGGANTHAGSDTNTNALTIDNLSPGSAMAASGGVVAGDGTLDVIFDKISGSTNPATVVLVSEGSNQTINISSIGTVY